MYVGAMLPQNLAPGPRTPQNHFLTPWTSWSSGNLGILQQINSGGLICSLKAVLVKNPKRMT